MTSPGFVVVTTTHNDRDQAAALAKGIVEQHLAACVQLVDIESVYRWEGEVEQAEECRLECKTRAGRVPALEEYIREHHSYDTPEIVVTPIIGGSQQYLDWVKAETAGPELG